MKDFEQLKSVWHNQSEDDPVPVDVVLKQVKKEMGTMSRKLFWNIVAMAAAVISMFVVLFFFVFQRWATYLGIIILLMTMLIYFLIMLRDYRHIYRWNPMLNTSRFLQHIKGFQEKRANFYGWVFYLYLLLLSTGLLLFFIEILQSASLYFKIFTYSLTLTWFLICTFYLKQLIFKNEQEKINLIIERLERLQHQFE